jgi:photosystem II stability/assembly factor-like uncharacterized protein
MWRSTPVVLTAFLLAFLFTADVHLDRIGGNAGMQAPSDWFYHQRAYPQGFIDPALRKVSLEQARALRVASPAERSAVWTQKGPSNIGGRITTMAISRQNPAIIYAGGAEGGVLKSTNAGVNWTPLFDGQPSLSMGSIAVDPGNDNIVYAGTGEANTSGDSYDGTGVFKSTDGGSTWFSVGLETTRRIGKIVIDPVNPAVIYVAAIGPQFSSTPDRGVYRSTDAGQTWSLVLFVNDSTGVVDIAINPQSPNILLAAAWQRMRGPQGRKYVGGVHTAIYRTTNAGTTWQKLAGGLPGPSPTLGRPAVAIAPSNPLVAYAAFADDPGNYAGTYRTTDGGDAWVRTADGPLSGLYSNFGWYFGKLFVSPFNENSVYVFGVFMGKSTNGGATWLTQNSNHVDHHAMAFHPTDPNILYVGNDGGRAKSLNGGATWSAESNQDLFISQFYAGAIDYLDPARSIGGTQDNGTIRTQTGAVADWQLVNGGDGFYAAVDQANSANQYAESQYGAIVRTTDNWATGFGATTGIGASDRKNWSTPIIIDPNTPNVLYTGTQYVYRSSNRAVNWSPISPDLSDGLVPGFSAYATVTTIDVAKADPGTIMAGTDDANVWVTTNGGGSWANISAGLVDRWVTRVRFDPTNSRTAYVTFSGYRYDTFLPHIFKTTNLGGTWQDISANLPEAPINVVLVDPQYTDRLYIGTDVGCYFTTNGGTLWQSMGTGLPNVAVSDMQIHAPTRIARAFTHGRSMWQINLDELVTGVAETPEQPVEFVLYQNYPNPFNGETKIGYRVSPARTTWSGGGLGPGGSGIGGWVRLKVYNLLGREVATLVDGWQQLGEHEVTFDASRLASGEYFCRLEAAGAVQIRRMLLIR